MGGKSGAFGWAAWHFDWDAKTEGSYVLSCRGVDAAGRTQDPLCDDQFNYTGAHIPGDTGREGTREDPRRTQRRIN